jgi:hypothetical protein
MLTNITIRGKRELQLFIISCHKLTKVSIYLIGLRRQRLNLGRLLYHFGVFSHESITNDSGLLYKFIIHI